MSCGREVTVRNKGEGLAGGELAGSRIFFLSVELISACDRWGVGR
jgi:hypothetical protein